MLVPRHSRERRIVNVRLGATDIRIPRDISTCRRFLPDQFRAESNVHALSGRLAGEQVGLMRLPIVRRCDYTMSFRTLFQAYPFMPRIFMKDRRHGTAIKRQKVTACPGQAV